MTKRLLRSPLDIERETYRRATHVVGGASVVGVLALLFWPRNAAASTKGFRLPGPAMKQLAEKWHAVFPNVSTELILGVSWLESHWSPSAVNDTGGDAARGNAWGLMQITGATASGLLPALQRRAGTSGAIRAALSQYVNAKSLLIPDLNVMFGTAYLSQLEEKFHDDTLVATAYKYGAGGVKKMGVDSARATERSKSYTEIVTKLRQGVA